MSTLYMAAFGLDPNSWPHHLLVTLFHMAGTITPPPLQRQNYLSTFLRIHSFIQPMVLDFVICDGLSLIQWQKPKQLYKDRTSYLLPLKCIHSTHSLGVIVGQQHPWGLITQER